MSYLLFPSGQQFLPGPNLCVCTEKRIVRAFPCFSRHLTLSTNECDLKFDERVFFCSLSPGEGRLHSLEVHLSLSVYFTQRLEFLFDQPFTSPTLRSLSLVFACTSTFLFDTLFCAIMPVQHGWFYWVDFSSNYLVWNLSIEMVWSFAKPNLCLGH